MCKRCQSIFLVDTELYATFSTVIHIQTCITSKNCITIIPNDDKSVFYLHERATWIVTQWFWFRKFIGLLGTDLFLPCAYHSAESDWEEKINWILEGSSDETTKFKRRSTIPLACKRAAAFFFQGKLFPSLFLCHYGTVWRSHSQWNYSVYIKFSWKWLS